MASKIVTVLLVIFLIEAIQPAAVRQKRGADDEGELAKEKETEKKEESKEQPDKSGSKDNENLNVIIGSTTFFKELFSKAPGMPAIPGMPEMPAWLGSFGQKP